MAAAKAEELQATASVALVRGGIAVAETGQWPDAWTKVGNDRIPNEVVRAFERPPGEDPRRGAVVAKALAMAEREATKQTEKDGKPRAWGAHAAGGGAQSWVADLTSDERIPPPWNPADSVGWIVQAVVQKMAKQYGPADRTILIVHHQLWAPSKWELHEIGHALERLGCPFVEVWVVSVFFSKQEEAALRVPLRHLPRAAVQQQH